MKNKSAKIFITVLSIVTIVAIMAGVYIHIYGKKIRFGYEKNVSKTVELEGNLNNIVTDIDVADVYISYGEKFCVKYDLPESMIPKINLNDGELEIKSKATVFSFNLLDFINEKGNIEIVIPEGTEISGIRMDNDAGNIKLNKINGNIVKINEDAGNVEFDGGNFSDILIESDAGNVKVNDSEIDNLSIDIDAGNIKMYNADIEYLDVESDTGNVKSDECTIKKGKITTDVGSINLNGEIGDVKTKTDVGKVKINGK